jgi:hypothetical protein
MVVSMGRTIFGLDDYTNKVSVLFFAKNDEGKSRHGDIEATGRWRSEWERRSDEEER